MVAIPVESRLFWPKWPRQDSLAEIRLFCFPYSGARASMYQSWIAGLPGFIEVCPIELPGRGARIGEPPYNQIGPLVEEIAQGLMPYLEKPFVFFGHSMGALLSFELARLLRRWVGREPVLMIVSGHEAPQTPRHEDPIHNLPEEEFIDRLRDFNGTQEEILKNLELRELIVPTLRADFALCETYAYTPDDPFDCPISVYGGLQDPFIARENLDAWRSQTTNSVVMRFFPGDHFYLNHDQAILLRMLAQELLQAANGHGSNGRKRFG